jgi:hypothetical protein
MADEAKTTGILTTGVSANHLNELQGLVASAQLFLPPTWMIEVVDLAGDLERRGWCRVKWRRIPQWWRQKHPWSDTSLTNSAWKPFIISSALSRIPPGGYVMYAQPESNARSCAQLIRRLTLRTSLQVRRCVRSAKSSR